MAGSACIHHCRVVDPNMEHLAFTGSACAERLKNHKAQRLLRNLFTKASLTGGSSSSSPPGKRARGCGVKPGQTFSVAVKKPQPAPAANRIHSGNE